MNREDIRISLSKAFEMGLTSSSIDDTLNEMLGQAPQEQEAIRESLAKAFAMGAALSQMDLDTLDKIIAKMGLNEEQLDEYKRMPEVSKAFYVGKYAVDSGQIAGVMQLIDDLSSQKVSGRNR